MTVGASLLLIASGAILEYAATTHVAGINFHTAGLILMIVGLLNGKFLQIQLPFPEVST
jgi:hypothetical protein